VLSSTVPLWVALVGPGATILVTAITLWFTNHREAQRQEHERRLKDAELGARRADRLRDERIAAYRKLLAATVHAPTEHEHVEQISQAYAEVELLAGSPELARAATGVWTKYGRMQSEGKKWDKELKELDRERIDEQRRTWVAALNEATDYRDTFLNLARQELGVAGADVSASEELPTPTPPDAAGGLESDSKGP
jgi:hypothetical protein